LPHRGHGRCLAVSSASAWVSQKHGRCWVCRRKNTVDALLFLQPQLVSHKKNMVDADFASERTQ
jgi:hypothetical protein